MKSSSIFLGLFKLAFISLFISIFCFDGNATATAITFASLVFLSCAVPMPKGVAFDTILEHWNTYIIERFFRDNGFLRFMRSENDNVVNGRIVHIPQQGAKPNVVKNRTTFPATAVRRGDTDVLYALDEYTTDPTHIPNIDAVHLSYDKQDSVLGDHMGTLTETVADDMLIKLANGAPIVRTTGAAIGPVTGQTGNRKGCAPKDMSNLMIKMNTENVPKKDRYWLFDDNMYGYFYDNLGSNDARDFSRYIDAENGVVGRLHGFNIMTRSSVIAAASNNSIKALGSSLAATDNLGCIAWQKDCVAFAMGSTMLFQDLKNPLYYGDIHSVLVMAGGRRRRADNLGIYQVLQDASA